MTPNQFLKLIPSLFATSACYFLRSAPGRGKSTMIEGAPPMLEARNPGKKYGMVVLPAPLMNPPDTIGYLVPTPGDHGKQKSEFTEPFWFYTSEGKHLSEYDGGIVFVDEVDKADVEVKKILGEMALSRRCGPHILPPGWVVWMAGNRAEDRSGATKELDHLINRRCEINLDDDFQSWEDWAMKNSIPPEVITFAKENINIVFESKVPEKQGPWCTPRSLVTATRALMSMAGPDGKMPTDKTAVELTTGFIGSAASSQLFAFIRLAHELPSYADILARPDQIKVPERPDAKMMLCYKLAGRVTEAEMDPVVTFMERMPKEFSVTFAKAACRREPELLNTNAMSRWCASNATLMTAIVEADRK